VSGIDSKQIVKICSEVAEGDQIVAVCLYGSRVCGYSREDSDYDTLMVVDSYQDGVRYQYEKFGTVYLALLKVDRELFELDVTKGVLGEFVAGRLLSPYLPLAGRQYLSDMEIRMKENVAEGELRELVLGYGELARGLRVRPEYILLSRMRRRCAVYPPLKYSYLSTLRPDLAKDNMPRILNGYQEALSRLSKKGLCAFEDDYIVLRDEYVDKIISRRTRERVINIVHSSQRALNSYIAHGRAGRVSLDMVARELASKIRREIVVSMTMPDLEEPGKYLFLKTSAGRVRLNETISIRDAVRKLRPEADIQVESLGGALNEVYLVKTGDDPLVAKRYSDWYGFKWFTLNLVALGTKTFSVSGRARLSNEYGMSTLLSEKGLSTPPVVYVSIQDKLLIKKYVDGKDVHNVFENCLEDECLDSDRKRIACCVGSTFAETHAAGITIGDSKPENLVLSKNDRLFFVDLEQAKKKGDQAWDIAEFLYFAGHHAMIMTGALKDFTRSFVDGYGEYGKKDSLRKAGGINYAKVFSFWTPPQIIYEISTILKST